MNMMSLRHRLLSNPSAKAYGPFLMSGSTDIAELIAGIGYDLLVVDMEHASLDVSETKNMLRAVDAAARRSIEQDTSSSSSLFTTPIVRVPSPNDIAMTKRVLDVLRPPAGIMFPMVENAEIAKVAVESTRYPSHYGDDSGTRGCAWPFVRASSYGENQEYYEQTCHQDLLTLVQVETENAINNIPEIAAVPGVDGIFLGPFDISCSIGRMGEFEEEGEVMKLMHYAESLVRKAAKESDDGLILGGFQPPGRKLKDMFSPECGYQLVTGSVDLGMIRQAASWYRLSNEKNENSNEVLPCWVGSCQVESPKH